MHKIEKAMELARQARLEPTLLGGLPEPGAASSDELSDRAAGAVRVEPGAVAQPNGARPEGDHRGWQRRAPAPSWPR